MEELDKQDNNKIPNPNGKGGFADNPQNINRNGRPKSGVAWKDIVINVGDEEITEGITRKDVIVRMVYQMAKDGNIHALRLLWNSMVGNKLVVDGSLGLNVSKLEQVIDDILNEDTENTEAN